MGASLAGSSTELLSAETAADHSESVSDWKSDRLLTDRGLPMTDTELMSLCAGLVGREVAFL